jgi:hypothetical protein
MYFCSELNGRSERRLKVCVAYDVNGQEAVSVGGAYRPLVREAAGVEDVQKRDVRRLPHEYPLFVPHYRRIIADCANLERLADRGGERRRRGVEVLYLVHGVCLDHGLLVLCQRSWQSI